MMRKISILTRGQGLHDITGKINSVIADGNVLEGLCHLFLQHTSAGLIIQENADVSVQKDLEKWLSQIAPENTNFYTHNDEGPDDMPAHIRSVVTSVDLAIPVMQKRLALGTWQAVYLWEHRKSPHTRHIIVHLGE